MFDFLGLGILSDIFGGAGYPMSALRCGPCVRCTTPVACVQVNTCAFQAQAQMAAYFQASHMNATCQARSMSYDVDLPPDAVREVQPTRALPAPLIEGDSDGGECD